MCGRALSHRLVARTLESVDLSQNVFRVHIGGIGESALPSDRAFLVDDKDGSDGGALLGIVYTVELTYLAPSQ